MAQRSDYYVYVYVDPRDFEEFYYGKGCGGRKESHLGDARDSDKTKRIRAILKDGEEPIIRVIAKGLTEGEALLVETTLIWKQGRYLTNLTQGISRRPRNSSTKPLASRSTIWRRGRLLRGSTDPKPRRCEKNR